MLNKSVIKKRILPTLLTSCVLPIIIFLSVPFEVFANNYEEFTFSFADFFPMAIVFFLLVTMVIFFILLFLPKKPYRIISAILISLAFMFFIQGTYLNAGMNSLAGDAMGGEENVSVWLIILNTVIWVVVIAVAILLSILLKEKKEGIASTLGLIVSFIVLATQIMSPLSISLSDSKVFMGYADRIKGEDGLGEYRTISNKDLTTISGGGNVFYFVLDRFDESYAKEAFERDKNVYDNLTGFTWFQNHVSVYGHTYPAVVNMITNELSNPSSSRKDNIKNLYEQNKTISVLSEEGYDINLYSEPYYAFGDLNTLPGYIKNSEVVKSSKITNKALLAFSVVGIGAYRGLPLLAKRFCFLSSAESNHYVDETTITDNKKYFCELSDLERQFLVPEYTTKSGKQFSFIHTNGCHDILDSDSSKTLDVVKENMQVVNKYINYLKQEDLYEDATIIITGDHGSPKHDNAVKMKSPTLTALFVKPSNKSEEALKTSNAPTSHTNIWATIMQSVGLLDAGDYGTSVFDIAEDDQTIERTYIWDTWTNNFTEYTYKIVGDANNFSNWQIVKEEHFNKAVMD